MGPAGGLRTEPSFGGLNLQILFQNLEPGLQVSGSAGTRRSGFPACRPVADAGGLRTDASFGGLNLKIKFKNLEPGLQVSGSSGSCGQVFRPSGQGQTPAASGQIPAWAY
jgi:hypothetical protein